MPIVGSIFSTSWRILVSLWCLKLLSDNLPETAEVHTSRLNGRLHCKSLDDWENGGHTSWMKSFGVSAEEMPHTINLDYMDAPGYEVEAGLSEMAQAGVDETLGYEANFVGFDRSILGRAGQDATALVNNIFQKDNLVPGYINYYHFTLSDTSDQTERSQERSEIDEDAKVERLEEGHSLQLEKRAAETTVYVTINTCLQPDFDFPDDSPQLTLFVSTSDSNQQPGPDTSPASQREQLLEEGFAKITVNTTGNVYVGVYGQRSRVNSGSWNYEVAASTDQPYHSFVPELVKLYMIDSDRNSSLLVSRNLSSATPPNEEFQTWLNNGPPLSLFVQNNASALTGITSSYCALKQFAQLSSATAADQITTGLASYNNEPTEQQFYIPNLIGQTSYLGILALSSNPNTPGGGGAISGSQNFSTKRFANCQLLYNLSFCSDVAYAVPANPATYPTYASLAALYDNSTATAYQNFTYSLAQIACNTTDTAQYSLAKTCTDCAAAYKTWLCAVSIPRCADWQCSDPSYATADPNTGQFLMPRNAYQSPILATPDILQVTNSTLLNWLATNSSRNNYTIAGLVKPGPYSEVLPCEDLCYELVRSCPAALGFGCPYPGRGLEFSYGKRGSEGPGGGPTCNEPGAVWGISGGIVGVARFGWLGLVVVVVSAFLLV